MACGVFHSSLLSRVASFFKAMPLAFPSAVLAEIEGTDDEKKLVAKKIDEMTSKELISATAAMKQYCKKHFEKNTAATNPNDPLLKILK